jgi:hypothetical protein
VKSFFVPRVHVRCDVVANGSYFTFYFHVVQLSSEIFKAYRASFS